MQRESMQFDVVIVGAGPAGLAAAIRLKQQARAAEKPVSVCIIDKAPELGAHTLSGAVMDPRALEELLPDWRTRQAPVGPEVTTDHFMLLSATRAYRLPHLLLPGCLHNRGHYLTRLGHLVRWLGEQAEAEGVEIFPGFAAAEALFNDDGSVLGVATGDMGLNRDGKPGPNYQPGVALHARYTLFAEGCRGHLGKRLETRLRLRENADPPAHALGLKELWEIDATRHTPGHALHTVGWPLAPDTYGGGFVYHLSERLLAIGLVVGLDYANPYLSPYWEFQRFKTHPEIRPLLANGQRLAYGARAIAAGGLQSLPRTCFPGGVLIGDDAGYLNAARQKGIHAAMKSGMLAAEAVFEALAAGRGHDVPATYPERFRQSWLYDELYRGRNFKPLMKKGLWIGATLFGMDQWLLRGKAPWTLHQQADHTTLQPARQCRPIDYPAPDGSVSFDLMSSVALSNTNHTEDQPCHLKLRDPDTPVRINLERYACPEQHYCPAGVFEIVRENGQARLQINAQNCIHCKSCDIKDPTQNIDWVPPQGGEGPIYSGM